MSRELSRAYRISLAYEDAINKLQAQEEIDISELDGRDRTYLGVLAKTTGLFTLEKKTVLRRTQDFKIMGRTEFDLKIVENN